MSSESRALPALRRGLSAKLLVLTIGFVMISEVLIYVPSIARFRLTFLEQRLDAAYLGSLALKAAPNYAVSVELEQELLNTAGVYMTAIKLLDRRSLMLGADMPPAIDTMFDLRNDGPMNLIMDAFVTLLEGERVIGVKNKVPNSEVGYIEIIMSEIPLRKAMLDYSTNILQLSIVISIITAVLVYLSLHITLVRPMRRITESMVRFRKRPEDGTALIIPTERDDEIGTAQRALAQMQGEIRNALTHKTRLAALGEAMAKVNHDLRNILATAQLLSDRLATSDDPEVRRISPPLVKSINRAVALCSHTLTYGNAQDPAPDRSPTKLAALLEDVLLSLNLPGEKNLSGHNRVPEDLVLNIDRDQIYRAFLNLARNAEQALQTNGIIEFDAAVENGKVHIDITDNGPGLPPKARDHLFEPFTGAARDGGTGLGLVIAQELVRNNGGDLSLVYTTDQGTRFRTTFLNDC